MADPSKQAALEWGSFSVRQGGAIVANGSGPFHDIMREAVHYAKMYGQDGPVRVIVRRLKPRAVASSV